MSLWVLKRKEWDYDEVTFFVIRAETQEAARKLAQMHGGYEIKQYEKPWLDRKQSSCTRLPSKGRKCVIAREFNAG